MTGHAVRQQDELVERAAGELRAQLAGRTPEVLLTLGSGLSGTASRIEDPQDIPMAAIPGLTASRVPGHDPRLRVGRLEGVQVLAQLGRTHLYEGHEAADVVRVVEVAATLGCTSFLVTNAAGGLDPSFRPGELMLLRDHLNLTARNPLVGVLRDGAPLFLDQSEVYDRELRRLAHDAAGEAGLELREGVYAGLLGPTYETPAEVRMLRTLGADAVGMSTVLEVIAARSHGMRVLGISSITNVHDGRPTAHDEVIDVGARVADELGEILRGVLRRLA